MLVSLVDSQFAPNVDIMASCTAGTTEIYMGNYIYTVDTHGTKIWTLIGPTNTVHPARCESSVSVALSLVQRTLPPAILHLEVSGYASTYSTITDIIAPITGNDSQVAPSTTATDVSGSVIHYDWTADISNNYLLSPSTSTTTRYPYYSSSTRYSYDGSSYSTTQSVASLTTPTAAPLPRHVVNLLLEKAIAEEVVCPITGDLIQNTAAVTSCGHIFNRTALMTWLATNRTCPTCRNICTSS